MTKYLFLFTLVAIVLPAGAGAAWFAAAGWPASWHAADWSSAGIAPDPRREREAIVQVYAARTGRWKGVFAVHSWIAVKPAGADRFARYDVVGWGRPVRRDGWPVDGRWYGNDPQVIREIRGPRAQALIPQIEAAVARYPFRNNGSYRVWPGPNSNTFVAWVARQVPGLGLEMPPTAFGKDYIGRGLAVARTPSGTGWQVSLGGFIGGALALREGIELHLAGATIGIDPEDLALKLPSVGLFGMPQIAATARRLLGS